MKNVDEQKYLALIQRIIYDLAKRGKTVIVGRGGQAILRDKEGVLHVRIVAPVAVRVERIVKNEKMSREDALKLIENKDKTTDEYLRRFYNIDCANPTIYDMVLNTSRIDLDTAAELIASTVRKM